MRAHRRALVLGAVVVGLGAALAIGVAAIATGRTGHESVVFARTAKLTVTRGAVGKGLSLDGTSLVARPAGGKERVVRLGGGDEVIAPLTGSLTPVAAASSDGSFVVYSSWRQLARIQPDARAQGLDAGQPVGIPSIRLFDLRSGQDALLASGAASPAVSTSGAIAYLAGDTPTVRQNVDYIGRIVVADSRDSKPSVWTSSSARYLPYAWARGTLLVHRGVPDSEGADLYAFTGPDEARLLAPDAFAIAVSPDGDEVLASVGIRTLELIRISNGAIEDTLSLDIGSADGPHAVMYAGSWQGDRIVANSDRGLLVLNTRGGLHVESTFTTPVLPHGINEPVLLDDTRVQGWADVGKSQATPGGSGEQGYDNALVDCDLATESCAVGRLNDPRKWARWVTNPSR